MGSTATIHWGDLDQDQQSEITQSMAHQTNRQIYPGKGFIGVFADEDLLYSSYFGDRV